MKKINYESALKKARRELQLLWEKDGNRDAMAELCGCPVLKDKIKLPFFDKTYTVSMPECSFPEEEPPIHEKILLFHYLSRPVSEAAFESGDPDAWVTFKQLPSAEFYNSTYQKRGPGIILSAFRDNPERLPAAGKKIGGEKGSYGDYSVRLDPLPKIRTMAVYYAGDEELPPEAEILFSGNIYRYLPLEDTAVLAGLLAVKLAKAAAAAEED